MITRVLAVGLLAGLVAGLSVAVLQKFTTTPIILAAEVYEEADEAKAQGASLKFDPYGVAAEARLILVHDQSENGAGEGAQEEWEPHDGLERTLYASTATIATAIGFALMILAGMLVAGDRIDERRAMAWAAAGFVVSGLAPGMGLSPEVPGIAAADLVSRQEWWLLTAVSTSVALWLIIRPDNNLLRLLGVLILLVPHIWGAPHLAEPPNSSVPAHLAGQFAATSLAIQATLWLLTGFFIGFWWRRIGNRGADQPV